MFRGYEDNLPLILSFLLDLEQHSFCHWNIARNRTFPLIRPMIHWSDISHSSLIRVLCRILTMLCSTEQVEAYSTEQEGCSLICRFATMGTVKSIQYSKTGKNPASCLHQPQSFTWSG